MSVDFDSDLFDAEVVLERAGVSDCTAVELGRVLASIISHDAARQRVARLLAAGQIPRPSIDDKPGYEARWSRRQVLQIVAQRLNADDVDEDEAPAASKHAPGVRQMGAKRPCAAHNDGRGANVSEARFKPGHDTCRECERRAVRVDADSISVAVVEGDRCIGHDCPDCGLPFEVGDRIRGENLHHENCS